MDNSAKNMEAEAKGAERERRLVSIFAILFLCAFVPVFFYSFLCSWENREFWNEFVYLRLDSPLGNLFWMTLVLILCLALVKLSEQFLKKCNMNVVAVVVAFLCMLLSIWWVSVSHTSPQGDQEEIVEFAASFENGDTSGLGQGEYLGYYRHQLGLITVVRVLFKLFGTQDYRCFQYFSAVTVLALVFFGFQVVKRISEEHRGAELLYLLGMLLCVPMYGYVPFVYGEICSTAAMMTGGYLLLSCLERFQWWKLLLLAGACGFAVMARQNMLVPVIGFLVVIAVKLIRKRNLRTAAIGGAVLAGVLLQQLLVQAVYAPYVPEGSEPIPSILYIAMGSHDQIKGAPGWHDESDKDLFREMNFDTEAASSAALEEFHAFVEKCVRHPDYALDFFTEKMNVQWNAPMYQCLVANNHFEGDWTSLREAVYEGWVWDFLDDYMNIYQLLCYGGVLLFLLFRRKEWGGVEKYALLIGVYGGFLFSLLWETKTRYVFPYLLFLLPYAAAGIESLMKKGTEMNV